MHIPQVDTGEFEVLAPRYAESFSCSGPDCPDHCCRGWGKISIDEKTLHAWKVITLPGQNAPLAEWTQPNDAGGLPVDRAGHLKLDPASSACSLLTESRLCSVHATLGEAFIPSGCRYPRARVLAGTREASYLSTGCPEVVRLILERPDALELVSRRSRMPTAPMHTYRRRTLGVASDVERADPSMDAIEASAELLAETARRWIGESSLSAWQAWSAHVAMLLEIVYAMQLSGDKARTIDMIVTLHAAPVKVTTVPRAASGIEQLGPDHWPLNERLDMAAERAQRAEARPGHSEAKQVLSCALEAFGLGTPGGEPADDPACAAFEQAAAEWFEPFDSKHRHLGKNFLLNRLGLVNFPSGDAMQSVKDVIETAIHLEMIRVYLVGMAAAKRSDFGAADYASVIQAYTRYVMR
jgi:lysine-N-methylase